MIDLVKKAIDSHLLISKGDNITVALSGGADSSALIYALNSLKEEYGFCLSACHLNHLIRGEEADRDENFVTELCRKLNVPLTKERIDVIKYAKENKMSTELAARKVRYDFFERVNKGKIATAHTASDSLETAVMNLVRGSGLDGLCGIPVKRDIYIRPLIYVTRKEVENYCRENNISYVTDSTNLTNDCTRNVIRHKIIPVFDKINKSCEKTFSYNSVHLKEDAEFINNVALSEFEKRYFENELSLENILKLPKAVINRLLLLYLKNENIEADSFHIEKLYLLLNEKENAVSLKGNKTVKIRNGKLSVFPKSTDFSVEVETEKEKNFVFNDKIHKLLLNNMIDCDKIEGELLVRSKKSGDEITLFKRNVTKSLKKLFIEEKVPAEIRDKIPVIADGKGVIWVYNIGVSKRVAVDKNTVNVLKIKTKENNSKGN